MQFKRNAISSKELVECKRNEYQKQNLRFKSLLSVQRNTCLVVVGTVKKPKTTTMPSYRFLALNPAFNLSKQTLTKRQKNIPDSTTTSFDVKTMVTASKECFFSVDGKAFTQDELRSLASQVKENITTSIRALENELARMAGKVVMSDHEVGHFEHDGTFSIELDRYRKEYMEVPVTHAGMVVEDDDDLSSDTVDSEDDDL